MIKRFIKYYKPHRKLLFVDLLFACLISIIDLVFPMVTKNVLKECETNQNLQFLSTILIIGLVLLIFYIIRFILSYFIGYYGHVMGIRLETDMRSDLFKKYQELDYQYFDDIY